MTKIAALQKTMTESDTATASIRMPEARDGKDIYTLVKKSGALDVNSEYAYLLLGAHFQKSCAVAEINKKIAGFVSAYIPPNKPHVLFIWQIAVDEVYRKRGIALTMLKDILCRPSNKKVKYIHATITTSNSVSRSFFTSLAYSLNTSLQEKSMFTANYFSKQHEDEQLFVIGPLIHLNKITNRGEKI